MKRSNVVYVQNQGIESTAIDSTGAPLGIGGTWVGSEFPTRGFAKIAGIAYPDVDGTLTIEQSSNGTDWDYSSEFSITGSDPTDSGFVVDVVGQYARVSYTNGAVAQASFSLHVFRRYS